MTTIATIRRKALASLIPPPRLQFGRPGMGAEHAAAFICRLNCFI
jgi:hypothetical protein